MKKESNPSPLTGIQVLDLTENQTGFCSKLLADLGARVIKIEPPEGDPSRAIGPFIRDSQQVEKSLSFLYNNTRKLGITLDLKQQEGRAVFRKLIIRSDILVETFPPGYLDNLNLGYGALKHFNAGLIHVSVTGFGHKGPKKSLKSCDLVAAAYGGQMNITGSPSKPPLKCFGEQSYQTASLFAVAGILLALRKRTQKGRGEYLDISLQEAVISTLEHVMVRYFSEHIIPERQGSRHWNDAFFILPCRDGFLQIAPFQQWETLVEWMDSEGMAGDLCEEQWLDSDYRQGHIKHILEVLERWTRTHTVDELFQTGQLMHFPWAPVHAPEDILASPQLSARHFFIETHPSGVEREMKSPAFPIKFSSISLGPQKTAPKMGEDNIRIYREELGMTAEEYERLRSREVI
jgi:crotonobetainyl-CoA:carnitine CoA-transferase CaiB-like acyl-CoA transferase